MSDVRAIVLTGGPAAGKSTVGRLVAERRTRGAVVEVDDLRHMLVQPHVGVWGGDEGQRQRLLGVRNACDVARNFLADGCEVVIADVLTDETVSLYRSSLAGPVIVRLMVSVDTAPHRARGRHYPLTEQEVRSLHTEQAALTDFDVELDTEELHLEETVDALRRLLD